MENTVGQLLEAWRTNNRINLLLIDRIGDEGMKCTLSVRGGRNVARQFAHLHNVRLWHLEKRARDLSAGLTEFETREEPDRRTLKRCLVQSGERIERFLEEAFHGAPKRRPSKKGVVSTLAYFIAHESHHRGNILLTLKQSGRPVAAEVRYAIWDWDRV
jgi:uncharacterized damage-inducible protein DinB